MVNIYSQYNVESLNFKYRNNIGNNIDRLNAP